MIAKAKSISHGINALNYITGVSANKKHPEKYISHLRQPSPSRHRPFGDMELGKAGLLVPSTNEEQPHKDRDKPGGGTYT